MRILLLGHLAKSNVSSLFSANWRYILDLYEGISDIFWTKIISDEKEFQERNELEFFFMYSKSPVESMK